LSMRNDINSQMNVSELRPNTT